MHKSGAVLHSAHHPREHIRNGPHRVLQDVHLRVPRTGRCSLQAVMQMWVAFNMTCPGCLLSSDSDSEDMMANVGLKCEELRPDVQKQVTPEPHPPTTSVQEAFVRVVAAADDGNARQIVSTLLGSTEVLTSGQGLLVDAMGTTRKLCFPRFCST